MILDMVRTVDLLAANLLILMLGDIVGKYFIRVERLDFMMTNKQKTRVGVFTYGMNDTLTGIGRYTKELTYALRDQYSDLEIVLISPYPESPLPWYRDFKTLAVPQLKRLPMVMARGSSILSAASKKLALDIFHDPCGIAPFGGGWPKSTRKAATIHDAIPLHHPEYQPFLTQWVGLGMRYHHRLSTLKLSFAWHRQTWVAVRVLVSPTISLCIA